MVMVAALGYGLFYYFAAVATMVAVRLAEDAAAN
jgi:hypothetical protein